MTATNKHPFGHLFNYQTGDVIRPATREDFEYAREHGQPHTGVYADLETGESVYCDGPDDDDEIREPMSDLLTAVTESDAPAARAHYDAMRMKFTK